MSLSHPSDHASQRSQVMRRWQTLTAQLSLKVEIHNPQTARLICTLIPAQCPFERDIYLFGQFIWHIPALCQLNPFYDQLMQLRFQALTFLADQCGEDVSRFCR